MELKNTTMWIYIPDKRGDREAWVGTISSQAGPKTKWSFELIRHVEPKDLYRTTPFEVGNTVIGLLDHQRACTLLEPLVYRIDPGTLGVRYQNLRTRIKGQFSALLTDLRVEDSDQEIFRGIEFASDGFTAWYAPPSIRTGFDTRTLTPIVEVKETERQELAVPGFGNVVCMSGASVSSGSRSRVISSTSRLRVKFFEPMSLNKVMNVCLGLEYLFGFLVGFRGRPPVFRVWTDQTYKVGERDLPMDGTLEFGGLQWIEGDPPHPIECIHLNGIGGTSLQSIMEKFVLNQGDFITRIRVVEFSRFFSNNLTDRFAVVMPVLENYLRAKYSQNEERAYVDSEQKFFDWVYSSDNDEIIEFSRKHIEVRDRKAPSLKTLIARAIDTVNNTGFCFPIDMAERIQKRRGQMFHSGSLADKDTRAFFDEVRAMTGLLMLHTYMDLGIELKSLAERPFSLWDLRGFVVRPADDNFFGTKKKQEFALAYIVAYLYHPTSLMFTYRPVSCRPQAILSGQALPHAGPARDGRCRICRMFYPRSCNVAT